MTLATREGWSDGQLSEQEPSAWLDRIETHLRSNDPLVVFQPSGITGPPDRQVATRPATRVAAERRLFLAEWGVHEPFVARPRQEFGVPPTGLESDDGPLVSVTVDHAREGAAIDCHTSQHPDDLMITRPLELSGEHDWLRVHPVYGTHPAAFLRRVGPLAVPDATVAK